MKKFLLITSLLFLLTACSSQKDKVKNKSIIPDSFEGPSSGPSSDFINNTVSQDMAK